MNNSSIYLVYTLALVKLIFPFFLIDANFHLHATEFINYDTAQYFAWGYLNEPPLLYWMSFLLHNLDSNFLIVKFVPAFFGALAYLFVGLTIVVIGGRLFAVFLAFLPFILSIYLPLQFTYCTLTLSICFFTGICFCLISYIIKSKAYFLYLFALLSALGLLSSNYFVWLLLMLILSLICRKEYRKLFINHHFLIALVLAGLSYLPHFIWRQDLVKIAIDSNTVTNTFLDFSRSQAFFMLGGIFIWIIGLLYLALTKKGNIHLPFLTLFIVANALFFIYQIDVKELLPIYSILLVFGSFNIERLTTRYVRIIRYISITPLFYMGFMNLPTYLPMLPPDKLADIYSNRGLQNTDLLVWDDSNKHELPQNFAEMIGYKEMAEKVSKIFHSVNEQDKAQTLVVSKNHGLTAALNFYQKEYNLPTTILSNDQCLFQSNINKEIVNVVFIGNPIPENNNELYSQFENSYLADEFTENNYSKLKGTKIMLYLKAKPMVNQQITPQKSEDRVLTY